MASVRLGVLGAILFCWLPADPAPGELPPAALEVVRQFEDEAIELDRAVERDLAAWREKTATALKDVQDAFCKDLKLDEAVAVRDVIRTLRADGEVVIANLPAAVQEAYRPFDREAEAIKSRIEEGYRKREERVTAELKKIQDVFCREAKLDEAVAVRDLIRGLRHGTANALPDPGYVNNGANDIGKVFTYAVIGATNGSIYGTDVYTTGSHLGMAAVHCGLLKAGQQGVVRVKILPGQGNYRSTTRNGITSIEYGNWGVSFKVERAFGFRAKPAPVPEPVPVKDARAKDSK